MYTPVAFSENNQQEQIQFMEQNPFATVMVVENGELAISHLPVTAKLKENSIMIIGHMAKANPQWKLFDGKTITLIFHGGHAYIDAAWYSKNDVPTWNYLVLHASGKASVITDENGLINCLQELDQHMQKAWQSQWKFLIPDDLHGDHLEKSIVGFEIKVEKINFKKKLSQRSSVQTREDIIRGLRSRTDENSQLIMQEMQKTLKSPKS